MIRSFAWVFVIISIVFDFEARFIWACEEIVGQHLI